MSRLDFKCLIFLLASRGSTRWGKQRFDSFAFRVMSTSPEFPEKENAQSSCCAVPRLPPVRNKALWPEETRPEASNVLRNFSGYFAVARPRICFSVIVLGSLPSASPPSSPSSSGVSLLSRFPLSDGEVFGAVAPLAGAARRFRGRGGGNVSGRAAPCPVQVLPLARYLQVREELGRALALRPSGSSVCELQTVKLVPGIFLSFFFRLEVDSTPSDGRVKHSRCA